MITYGQLEDIKDVDLNTLFTMDFNGVYSVPKNLVKVSNNYPNIKLDANDSTPPDMQEVLNGRLIVKNTPFRSIQEFHTYNQRYKRIGVIRNERVTYNQWQSQTIMNSYADTYPGINDFHINTSTNQDVIYTTKREVENKIIDYIRNVKGTSMLPPENGPQSIYDPTPIKNIIDAKLDDNARYAMIPNTSAAEANDYVTGAIPGTLEHGKNEFFYGKTLRRGNINIKNGEIVFSDHNYKTSDPHPRDGHFSARGFYYGQTSEIWNARAQFLTINNYVGLNENQDIHPHGIDEPQLLAYGNRTTYHSFFINARVRAEVVAKTYDENNDLIQFGKYTNFNGNNASQLLVVEDLKWKMIADFGDNTQVRGIYDIPDTYHTIAEIMVETNPYGVLTNIQQQQTYLIPTVPAAFVGHEYNGEQAVGYNNIGMIHRIEDVTYYNGVKRIVQQGDFMEDSKLRWIAYRG